MVAGVAISLDLFNMATSAEELTKLFTGIGLSDQKAKETIKNESLASSLKQVIEEVS